MYIIMYIGIITIVILIYIYIYIEYTSQIIYNIFNLIQ